MRTIFNVHSLLAHRQRVQTIPVPILLLLVLLLNGCTAPSLQQRIQSAAAIAQAAALQGRIIHSQRFNLQMYQRRSKTPQTTLVIYIEGDGLAWTSRHRVSLNPTPINPVALQLAARDPSPALVYLARPCQYLPLAKEPNCNLHAWTDARYSQEIITAYTQILTRLKAEYGSTYIGLVGFSGGGTIAALLAAQRHDVRWLVTIAGNLNPELWARWHNASPLAGSLNPVDKAPRLETIPQLHLLGGQDEVMPAAVAESYRAALRQRDQIRIVSLPEQGHGCCWQQIWPAPLCANIALAIPSCQVLE